MCMGIFPTCMCVYHVCTWCLWRPEKGVRSPGTWVTGGWELPCGGWELNPGPLQEQPGLLTDEPSLQLPVLTAQNTVPFVYKELNQYLLGNAGIFISKKESYIFICIGYNNEWYEPLRSLKHTKTFLPNLHLYPSLVFQLGHFLKIISK